MKINTIILTREKIKLQAKILKEFLNQGEKTISLSSCLQAVAKMYGYEDWNTASAMLENTEEQS